MDKVLIRRRLLSWRTFVSLGLELAFISFIFFQLRISPSILWHKVRGLHPLFYLAAFFIHYLSFPLRGKRWQILLKNINVNPTPATHRLAINTYLGFFVDTILYVKLGQAYRAYMLQEEEKIDFFRSIGTIFVEGVLDAIVVFLLLAIFALILWGRAIPLPILIAGIATVFGFPLVLVIIEGMRKFILGRLPLRLKRATELFREGSVGSLKKLPNLISLSIVIRMLEAGRLLLITEALGFPLSIWLIFFVSQAITLLATIPFTPGGLGLVEPGASGILMMFIPREEAWGIVLIDRTITYLGLVFLGGLIFFLKESIKLKRYLA